MRKCDPCTELGIKDFFDLVICQTTLFLDVDIQLSVQSLVPDDVSVTRIVSNLDLECQIEFQFAFYFMLIDYDDYGEHICCFFYFFVTN